MTKRQADSAERLVAPHAQRVERVSYVRYHPRTHRSTALSITWHDGRQTLDHAYDAVAQRVAEIVARTAAVQAADQQNARLRDERERSPDGMTASERAMAQSATAGSADVGATTPLEELPDGEACGARRATRSAPRRSHP